LQIGCTIAPPLDKTLNRINKDAQPALTFHYSHQRLKSTKVGENLPIVWCSSNDSERTGKK
jgi:hypothetical protein